jgi:KR domain
MDLILNCLTSPGMIAGSLAIASYGASFVEVGKREIWSHARLEMERSDVTYKLIAIDFMPPEVLKKVLHKLGNRLSKQAFLPISGSIYCLNAIVVALKGFAHAQCIGKFAISLRVPRLLCKAGTWILTGGMGSLGCITAQWLKGQGLKHLRLSTRSGR